MRLIKISKTSAVNPEKVAGIEIFDNKVYVKTFEDSFISDYTLDETIELLNDLKE